MSTGTSSNQNGKLLDYYQAIISRLAGNSSSTKGWAITVATAVVGFGVKDGPIGLAYLALVPLALFFMLDAYYLAAERAYRDKYNEASKATGTPLMSIPGKLVTMAGWLSAAGHPITWGVYLVLAIVALVIGAGWITAGG
jgi:hypothetical protein